MRIFSRVIDFIDPDFSRLNIALDRISVLRKRNQQLTDKNLNLEIQLDQANHVAEIKLRDQFAMAALNGMLSYSAVNPMSGNYHENCTIEDAAIQAYRYADAMIKARGRDE